MKKRIIIIISIVLLIVFIVGVLFLFKNNKKEDSIVVKKKYYEVEDTKLIEDITNKINYISSRNGLLFNDGIINSFYFNQFLTEKLFDDDKNYIVLDSLYSENKFRDNCISSSKVNDRYERLFGSTMKSSTLNNRDSIVYKKDGDKYCVLSNSSYDLDGYMYMYINRIVTNDNYIKAYVNYCMSGKIQYSDKWVIYDSLDNNLYKNNLSLEEVKTFRITEENHNDFEEYEYLFKRKEDNYYFVRVEEK